MWAGLSVFYIDRLRPTAPKTAQYLDSVARNECATTAFRVAFTLVFLLRAYQSGVELPVEVLPPVANPAADGTDASFQRTLNCARALLWEESGYNALF